MPAYKAMEAALTKYRPNDSSRLKWKYGRMEAIGRRSLSFGTMDEIIIGRDNVKQLESLSKMPMFVDLVKACNIALNEGDSPKLAKYGFEDVPSERIIQHSLFSLLAQMDFTGEDIKTEGSPIREYLKSVLKDEDNPKKVIKAMLNYKRNDGSYNPKSK